MKLVKGDWGTLQKHPSAQSPLSSQAQPGLRGPRPHPATAFLCFLTLLLAFSFTQSH